MIFIDYTQHCSVCGSPEECTAQCESADSCETHEVDLHPAAPAGFLPLYIRNFFGPRFTPQLQDMADAARKQKGGLNHEVP